MTDNTTNPKRKRKKPTKLPIQPDFLFSVATSLLEGAEVARRAAVDMDQEHLYTSFYLQIGFVLELYLKFYLTTAGMSVKDVEEFGHDIEWAHEEAVNRGLVFINSQALSDIVRLMEAAHNGLSWRYMPDGIIKVPRPPENVVMVLASLREHLQPMLNNTYTTPVGSIFET